MGVVQPWKTHRTLEKQKKQELTRTHKVDGVGVREKFAQKSFVCVFLLKDREYPRLNPCVRKRTTNSNKKIYKDYPREKELVKGKQMVRKVSVFKFVKRNDTVYEEKQEHAG